MEGFLSEKQKLEEVIEKKDAEIEELKKEQQDLMSKSKKLEAELDFLRKITVQTISSSLVEKKSPNSLAKLPARPPSPKQGQQPISLLANLPARPAFTGFDTPRGIPAPQPSFIAPRASPQMLPSRPTDGLEPTPVSTTPPSLPTRPETRSEGTVPPLLPHHKSFHAVSDPSPPSTAPKFDFPLPPVSKSTRTSSTVPALFDFRQQDGRPSP